MFNRNQRRASAGISVRFDDYPEGHIPTLSGGSTLTGAVSISPEQPIKCKDVALKLGWHTEGKGDRDAMTYDTDIIHVTEISAEQPVLYPFRFELPAKPWSYNGEIIQIVWALNVEIDVDSKVDLFGMMDIKQTFVFILQP